MNIKRLNAQALTMAIGLLVITAWPHAEAAVTSAEDLYKTYCVQCHGLNGKGKGINDRDMSVQPRDHTDAEYMGGRSNKELFKAIKEGGQAVNKSVLMPPWDGVLSDEQINQLVEYLRVLCDCRHGG